MSDVFLKYIMNLPDREKKLLGWSELKVYIKNGKWIYEKVNYQNDVEKEIIQTIEIPKQQWFNLTEACKLKGINYKSANNRPYLKPRCGKEDGIIAGVKKWKLETILGWLGQTDDELKKLYKEQNKKNDLFKYIS